MQIVPVVRVVDAEKSQGRFIIQLRCGHNLTLWTNEVTEYNPTLVARVRELARQDGTGQTWKCDYCPDPPQPTVEELRAARTASQLWQEAGEP